VKKIALRDDWKTTPLPAQRKVLALDRLYTPEEFNRIAAGVRPGGMECKWFIFHEEPWLYLHRSWTGFCIYQVRFEPMNGQYRVVEVLVSRDPTQYGSTNDRRDILLLAILLDRLAGRDCEPLKREFHLINQQQTAEVQQINCGKKA